MGEEVVLELTKYDWIDWTILVTGLLYAFFSVSNMPVCWGFGIISCGLLSWKDYSEYQLFFDSGLQLLFVYMGIVGLYRWIKSKKDTGYPRIETLPFSSHLNALFFGTITSLVLVLIVQLFVNPAFVFLDSVTTVFSIWATWLLVNRIYENWIYWLFINTAYIYMFYAQGGTLVAILYTVYLATAITGLISWNYVMRHQRKKAIL